MKLPTALKSRAAYLAALCLVATIHSCAVESDQAADSQRLTVRT